MSRCAPPPRPWPAWPSRPRSCCWSRSAAASTAGAASSDGSSTAGATESTGRGDAPKGVQTFTYEFGPLDIQPGQNVIETSQFRIPQPTEDGWIVGFRPDLRLKNGTDAARSTQIHLHHGVWVNGAALDRTALLPERFFAAGEEKTFLEFPPGYGYQYSTSDYWFLNYMIHNLTAKPYKVSIIYEVDFLPATARQAEGDEAGVAGVDGRAERRASTRCSTCSRAPAPTASSCTPTTTRARTSAGRRRTSGPSTATACSCTRSATSTPVACSVDLSLRVPARARPGSPAATSVEGDTARLFTSKAKYYEPAGAVSWDVSMTRDARDWAVGGEAGDVLRLTDDLRHVAGVVVRVDGARDRVDGRRRHQRRRPVHHAINRKGVLTHGHLPENDNHGGKATDAAPTRSEPPTARRRQRSRSASSSTAPATSPRRAFPTVPQGGSITFDNFDADARTCGTR